MKVILGKASASSKNEKFPKGEIHAVLMFVKTKDKDKAQKVAEIKVQKHGWSKIKMSRIGSVNLETFKSGDVHIQKALSSAIDSGFGLMVYPEIENDLNL